MRKLSEYFSHAKIRTKMLLSYITILLTAVITICFLMYFYTMQIYKDQLLYSANQSFGQAKEFLGYRIDSVLYVSNLIRVNESVQSALSKQPEEIQEDVYEQYTDMRVLENYIYSICNSIDIYQISLYVPDYLTYSDQEVLFRNLNRFQETEEYDRLLDANDAGVWLSPRELYSADTNKTVRVISYLQNIKDISQMSKTVGVQRVSVRSSDIDTMMEKSNITTSGIVWIENKDGELISCSNAAIYEEMGEGIAKLREEGGLTENWETKVLNGETYFVRGEDIEKTDWKLIAALPNQELFQASSLVLKPMIPIFCILVIVAAVMAIFFSRMITSRISRLATQMEAVEDHIVDLTIEDEGIDDEIGHLFQSFQYMSNRLKELMDREYENGKAVKHAELKALQAQINPHFLYNTLDLINWEALDCGADRITKISQALAKFYKLSLNKGKEFSRIKDELAHVEYYVMIQNFRYNDRIKLNQSVPKELMECEILHIVLQPLVENSFVHGMAGQSETAILQLSIDGYAQGEDIVLEVADSGCGMSQEQMEMILGEQAKEGSGYGVRNIHMRIRLVYGEEYGLKYFKNEWGGVTVRIRFPKERKEMR